MLDEPTANLDQEAIARLHDQISALKRQGCTIVVAEHRLYFLTDLIDRAFYLRSGVLERTFTGEQFRSLPDPEREALGLRTLTPAVCTLPSVEPAGTKEGLSIEGLACAFRKEAPVFRDLSFSARPGEVVADLCAGSGTTAVAALNTGRRFVCFESAPAMWWRSPDPTAWARPPFPAAFAGC